MLSLECIKSFLETAVIVLNLECAQAHQFEGWFASSEAFELQCAQGMVPCPVCGEQKVHRRPSAPHVARAAAPSPAPEAPPQPAAAPNPVAILSKMIEALRKDMPNMEDVGEHFADEARKIHYGDAEERPIRGQASVGEAVELLEEGISVLPLPPAKENLH